MRMNSNIGKKRSLMILMLCVVLLEMLKKGEIDVMSDVSYIPG